MLFIFTKKNKIKKNKKRDLEMEKEYKSIKV